MYQFRKLLFPIVTIALLAFSCTEEDTTPKITAIEPLAGDYNDEITLSGVNFDQELSNNFVRFGSAGATIVSGDKTHLIVKVPANAPSGKIEITNNNGTSFSAQSFTVTAGSWVNKVSAPVYLTSSSSTVMVINDAAYIVRGKTNVVNGPSDPAMLLKYDGNVWTTMTIYDAQASGSFLKSWSTPGGKGYVLDGFYKLMEYNPQTDSWTSKAVPVTRANPIGSFSIGELGYVLFSDAFNVYNPVNNSWGIMSTNYKTLSLSNALFVSSGTKAYLACDQGIYQLDPVLGNWTYLTDIPRYYGSSGSFFLYGNNQLILGTTFDFINETWLYDISTNTWTQKRGFNTGRSWPISFTLANQHYVGMGSDAQPPNILRSDLYMYTAN